MAARAVGVASPLVASEICLAEQEVVPLSPPSSETSTPRQLPLRLSSAPEIGQSASFQEVQITEIFSIDLEAGGDMGTMSRRPLATVVEESDSTHEGSQTSLFQENREIKIEA